jgi:pimeloyl-ACP methyl ester carboxylesterase/DNA-binding CsgD family transcriptional regulator
MARFEPVVAKQQVRFCRAPDGVRIAYAVHGSGPPLVVSTCWLSHLQHDWQSPVWRHFLEDLGRFATIIRYDERGFGLSDWEVDDFSLDARVSDLEAVVDDCGLDDFALMAMSQGGPVAIAYVARHPERVSRMMFYGSQAAALADPTAEAIEMRQAFVAMIKVGWARTDSAFRRVFTSLMIPEASDEQMSWLDELQRVSATTENAVTAFEARTTANSIDLLPQIDMPTIVLHARGDRMNEFDNGLFLASNIDGARLVALESSNHILLEDEPAWPVFVSEVEEFMEPERSSRPAGVDVRQVLSARELEVLRLAADGYDNDAIAEALTLSVRTVERHLHNIYAKLEINGKSARAAAVAKLLSPV